MGGKITWKSKRQFTKILHRYNVHNNWCGLSPEDGMNLHLIGSQVKSEEKKAKLKNKCQPSTTALWKKIWESTHHLTLSWTGCSSGGQHHFPFQSAKNKEGRLHVSDHQDWTTTEWNNKVWSEQSRFVKWHTDDRLRMYLHGHSVLFFFSRTQACKTLDDARHRYRIVSSSFLP